jgi:hypothetical protein
MPDRKPFGRAEWALVLATIGCWAIARPYAGLVHDARLYALQALGRLHPDSLGQDLFLRFGSQDSFTIFSPAYATLISVLGTEAAARWLTLLGQVWWFVGFGWIAITLLGGKRGLLATALAAALPGFYGAWDVFRYAEPFLTARLFAESAVLTGIALLIGRRPVGSALAMAIATFIHPLMGIAGVLLWTGMVIPRRYRWLLASAVLLGASATVAIAFWRPVYPLSLFDPEWSQLARLRSPFISMLDWNAESFRVTALPLLALWLFGREWREARGQDVLAAALLAGSLGLAVTLVGATLAEVVLVTQGQAWRWVWVATALAPMAAVAAVPAIWKQGGARRASILLLATAWILQGTPALVVAGSAVLAFHLDGRLPQRMQRFFFLAATAVFVASLAVWAHPFLGSWSGYTKETARALSAESLQLLARDGVLLAAMSVAIYWTASRRRERYLSVIAAALMAIAGLGVAVPRLTSQQFQAAGVPAVAEWQAVIPRNAEVFWPEHASAAWFLLERRSYVSSEQASGILFSPQAAAEIERRVDEVSLILPPAFAFRAATEGHIWRPTSKTVTETCRRSKADFVVSEELLDLPQAAPPLTLMNRTMKEPYEAHLYRCSDLRQAASVSDRRSDNPT